MSLENARIPELAAISTLADDDMLPIYDKSSGVTKRVSLLQVKEAQTSSNLQYSSTVTYDTPATAATSGNPSYAEYNNKLWKSLINNNTGNIPTEGANWTEVSPTEGAVIPQWAAGIYTKQGVIVEYNSNLFKLTAGSVPFESTNLVTELEAEQWLLLTGLSTIARTGAVVKFNVYGRYGEPGTPVTGNITFDETNAVRDMHITMYHNDATEPTFPATAFKMSGSGDYIPNELNSIDFRYISTGRIEYTITQFTS